MVTLELDKLLSASTEEFEHLSWSYCGKILLNDAWRTNLLNKSG